MSSRIKRITPGFIKFPLWYLFKSPQRGFGWYTLRNDIQGILILLFRLLVHKKQQPVSICTGIYNRTDNYLNQLLKSLQQAKHPELIELSVFDCGSDDTANLENEIRKRWKGRIVFQSKSVKFSRSYTFNQAVLQASSQIVFLCDADISLPGNIVQLCNDFTAPRQAWFPICFFLFRDKPAVTAKSNGEWLQYAGKGMLACMKKDFAAAGMLNEDYKEWGPEDEDLWERLHRKNFIIIRNRQKDFFHHWHTTYNPKFQYMN